MLLSRHSLTDAFTAIFDEILPDHGGKLSKKKLTRAMMKPKFVAMITKVEPSLEKLLRPRKFAQTLSSIDEDGNSDVEIVELVTFILEKRND